MKRGEIWWVDFTPTRGQEITKLRPAVVVSRDGLGKLELRVVVPLTEWQDSFRQQPWMIQIIPSWQNGLDKTVAADGFQVKSVSTDRFDTKKGEVTPQELEDILAAVVLVLGYI
jgi:mRNA interferase MazF